MDTLLESENAQDIAVDFVKRKKNVKDINVATVELKDDLWVIRGTCPIDLSGHPWRESFEIRIDKNGKVKTSSFNLM